MRKIFFTIIILTNTAIAQGNGEILKCEGTIVNSRNEFEKSIIFHIDIVIPSDNAEKYVLTLADKDNGQFKSFLKHNPIVRKTFIEIATSLNSGKRLQPERYEFIVTKMPNSNNSLYGFIYGYTPWVLQVDTWMQNKPFSFFKAGELIRGECK